MFAILPFVKRLTELAHDSAANTRRIKVVWYTDQKEAITHLHNWMQSLLDKSVLDKSLLSITIHTTYDYSETQVHREGERLCIIADVPDIDKYLSTELYQSRRSLAVVVSAFSEFREDVRRRLLQFKRQNARLYCLDYQPTKVLKTSRGTAI
ncbi:hypothetical protein LTR17_026273 [Elasticomyces elasticus]|nr:hypothetical protein LTR17_026273 [Elasticomyces elasticus]